MKRSMMRGIALAAVALFCGVATADFQASDLIYVPVAAHNEGIAGSTWRTDLYITNVDSTDVDVAIFFMPAGLSDNSVYLADRSFGMGPVADAGFGVVDEQLANIPPGGTRSFADIVGESFAPLVGTQAATLGGLIVYAWESGTLDSADGRVYRNVLVQSRTYNATTIVIPPEDTEVGEDPVEGTPTAATYGQLIEGMPWYNLADPAAVSELGDFSYVILTGGEETTTTRYNLGVFNTSDKQTAIHLLVTPLDENGEPFLDEENLPKTLDVFLPPLAQLQYNRVLATMLGIEDVTNVSFKVEFVGWETSGTDPIPSFACYGSLVDSRSNDATTFTPTFAQPYDVDCMWPPQDGGDGTATAQSGRYAGYPVLSGGPRSGRRPLELPRR